MIEQCYSAFCSINALTNNLIFQYYYTMATIVAVLFEEKLENSYVALQLDGPEPEILFTKGPDFTKRMGPFPEAYAEATFRTWNYCKVSNPPQVFENDPGALAQTLQRLRRESDTTACFAAEGA